MKLSLHRICLCLLCLLPLTAQEGDPVIEKENVSLHTVERGNMPLFAPVNGSLTSVQPLRVALTLSHKDVERCEPGRSAKLQIDPSPKAISGKVAKASEKNTAAPLCEVESSEAAPAGVTVGLPVKALIEVDELKNVVFFGRPANSSPNSTTTLFVVEPGSSFARRATVRYGKMSGQLIQVLDGLAPGDHVIVTDMSKWAAYPRVRIQ